MSRTVLKIRIMQNNVASKQRYLSIESRDSLTRARCVAQLFVITIVTTTEWRHLTESRSTISGSVSSSVQSSERWPTMTVDERAGKCSGISFVWRISGGLVPAFVQESWFSHEIIRSLSLWVHLIRKMWVLRSLLCKLKISLHVSLALLYFFRKNLHCISASNLLLQSCCFYNILCNSCNITAYCILFI